MPDFAVGADGRASTRSLELKNPAVRIRFESGAQRSQAVWLSLLEPQAAYKEDAGGVLERSESPPLRLVAVDPVLISGIQAGSDPGFPLTALGCGAWLLGSCLLFYLHRRRVWVLVEPGRVSGESRVSIGGWSSRGPEAFREEFDAVVRALKAAQA